VATSESVLGRKISSSSGSWFTLHDFLVALVALAHARSALWLAGAALIRQLGAGWMLGMASGRRQPLKPPTGLVLEMSTEAAPPLCIWPCRRSPNLRKAGIGRVTAPCPWLPPCRFAAESFGGATAPLSTQVLSLLQECISAQLYHGLQKKLERFEAARSGGVSRLLAQGRRCGRWLARPSPGC
jgi:hypothetical protein